ncbi:hypothetical protein ACHAC9_09405 [Massilia sp. CMS3.1]|uniref:hypothetical protein n=1 Tax=Massilia sp. CMS3.1 TaxID=3373083 RepID=UPI003EE51D53
MSTDSYQSVYREKLLEHLLVGELLKYSWFEHGASLEVSQPAIDRAGHDIVLEANGVTRHVQLKTSSTVATTGRQNVHLGLAQKPSGCVIWVRFDPASMVLGPFLFFGSAPGAALPALDGFKVAMHTKGNAQGIKAQRHGLRVVPLSKFKAVDTIAALYATLFGKPGHDKAPAMQGPPVEPRCVLSQPSPLSGLD